MIEFIKEYAVIIISALITAIGGLWVYFTKKRETNATIIKIEGDNTDATIKRLRDDNDALSQENRQLKIDNKKLCDENDNVMDKNSELLEELHQLKIKIADLTNQIIRLEAKFRINNQN